MARQHGRPATFLGTLVLGATIACGQGSSAPAAAPPSPRAYRYEVLASFPHDPGAFTEGLVLDGDQAYESTGSFNGTSSLREIDLRSGAVLRRFDLAPEYFGEGLTVMGDRLIQLTWKSQKGFVYDRHTLQRTAEFSYAGEGWGLTHDADSLIMSNGSDELRFLDPASFAVRHSIRVRDGARPVSGLNELELVDGEVYANVFPSNEIVRINPRSGSVTGRIDMSGLLATPRDPNAVLNGIAHDPRSNRLYVTGKLSARLYEVRLIAR
ncbi:MAG: glutaminyl-peptide cyclotransferase [Candidatus Dormibacteria bacterium]